MSKRKGVHDGRALEGGPNKDEGPRRDRRGFGKGDELYGIINSKLINAWTDFISIMLISKRVTMKLKQVKLEVDQSFIFFFRWRG